MLKERLPDGRNRLIHRLQWARTYLKKAGLIDYPQRGAFKITKRGIEILKTKPVVIDNKLLSQFPEFVEFKHRPEKQEEQSKPTFVQSEAVDPEESLQNSYLALRREVEADILEKVKSSSPTFFENLVVDLLLAMGYGGSKREAGRAIGKSGDEGIDGVIDEDSLGLDVIYIQAKRWTENSVGRPEVQKFIGALQTHHARKGVFIVASSFSKEARECIKRIDNKIVLIDGTQLASLMFDYGVGVSAVKSYAVKRVDSDYFEE